MNERLVGLDALRGIAALIVVVVCHPGYLVGPMHVREMYQTWDWLFSHAEIAVDLFFVISGYVFVHVYADRDTSARDFALARFARLYPLHIVMLLVTVAIFAVGQPAYTRNTTDDPYHLVLNLFMLQGSGLETGYSFNTPSWSISVEVICYAIFWFSLQTRRFTILAVVLCLSGVALVATDLNPHLGRGLAGFFAGALAYDAPKAFRWAILLAIPIFAFAPREMLNPLLSLSAFPALLLMLRDWRPGAALLWLGDRSYSIYLIHTPVFWALSLILLNGAFVPGYTAAALVVLGACTVLILSDLSYRFLETPARKWLNAGGKRVEIAA